MHVMTNIVNSDTHYLDMYSVLSMQIVNAKNYWDLMISKRLQDKFESRLYELHDAEKITGLMAMQYVVEIEEAVNKLSNKLNITNRN